MKNLIQSIDQHIIQWFITIGLLLLLLIFHSIALRMVKRHTARYNMGKSRETYIKKLVSAALIALFATFIGSVWEISIQGLSLYFASIFTVVGVALFASWSILSNMTASIVLFFFFPYRIGDRIRIIDGDNSVEGKIIDIKLFYIQIEGEDGKIYSYPNNLVMQKAVSTLSPGSEGQVEAE